MTKRLIFITENQSFSVWSIYSDEYKLQFVELFQMMCNKPPSMREVDFAVRQKTEGVISST